MTSSLLNFGKKTLTEPEYNLSASLRVYLLRGDDGCAFGYLVAISQGCQDKRCCGGSPEREVTSDMVVSPLADEPLINDKLADELTIG